MDAPEIILPVNSKSNMTLVADLGRLKLSNRFVQKERSVFDTMEFRLSDLKLLRAKYRSNSCGSYSVVSKCTIIEPITFLLTVERNMVPSTKVEHPPEISVKGMLGSLGHAETSGIKASMSKEDYNIILSFQSENLNEKVQFFRLAYFYKKIRFHF